MLQQVKQNVGDVFSMPLCDRSWSAGQIISILDRATFFLVSYGVRSESLPTLDVVGTADIVFAGTFIGTKIPSGSWKLVGNTAPDTRVRLPPHTVFMRGKHYVESWDCMRRREATNDEVRRLTGRSAASSVTLEHAMQWYFGQRDWHKFYDRIDFFKVLQWLEVQV